MIYPMRQAASSSRAAAAAAAIVAVVSNLVNNLPAGPFGWQCRSGR
jgi:Na+/H+ antiporter NhaD/arsenite permease-like protein